MEILIELVEPSSSRKSLRYLSERFSLNDPIGPKRRIECELVLDPGNDFVYEELTTW